MQARILFVRLQAVSHGINIRQYSWLNFRLMHNLIQKLCVLPRIIRMFSCTHIYIRIATDIQKIIITFNTKTRNIGRNFGARCSQKSVTVHRSPRERLNTGLTKTENRPVWDDGSYCFRPLYKLVLFYYLQPFIHWNLQILLSHCESRFLSTINFSRGHFDLFWNTRSKNFTLLPASSFLLSVLKTKTR